MVLGLHIFIDDDGLAMFLICPPLKPKVQFTQVVLYESLVSK